MAYDGINITEGAGEVVASDLIAAKQYQRVKVAWGAEGTATEIAAATPLPVTDADGLTKLTSIDSSLTTALADTDPVTITNPPPTAIYHGRKTVTTAGTEVALASSQAILLGVTVKALAANTGVIYVGANPVTSSTGFELAAGESVFIGVANLATVYIDASVNGEGVTWVAS